MPYLIKPNNNGWGRRELVRPEAILSKAKAIENPEDLQQFYPVFPCNEKKEVFNPAQFPKDTVPFEERILYHKPSLALFNLLNRTKVAFPEARFCSAGIDHKTGSNSELGTFTFISPRLLVGNLHCVEFTLFGERLPATFMRISSAYNLKIDNDVIEANGRRSPISGKMLRIPTLEKHVAGQKAAGLEANNLVFLEVLPEFASADYGIPRTPQDADNLLFPVFCYMITPVRFFKTYYHNLYLEMMGGDWNCENADDRQKYFRAALAPRWPQFRDLNRTFHDFERMTFAPALVKAPNRYAVALEGSFSDGGFGALGYNIDLLEKGKYFSGIYQGSGPKDADIHTHNVALSVSNPEFIVGYAMYAVPDIYKARENTLPDGVVDFLKEHRAVLEEYHELLPQPSREIIDPILQNA
jgi:hypothetical protein